MDTNWKVRLFNAGGTLIWIITFLVLLVISSLASNISVASIYLKSAQLFADNKPLYNLSSDMGYLYAPAFAALYTPLLKLDPYLGAALWRILNFALISYAFVRQARVLGVRNPLLMISWGLLVSVALTTSVFRMGQSTLLMAAACWMLTLSVLEGKRLEIVVWTALAFIAKPIAIVALLLAGALRPRLAIWIVLGLLLVVGIPYAFAPVDYVNAQNSDFMRLLTALSVDKATTFIAADFTAPFIQFGLPLSETTATVIRAVAAFATLAAVIYFDRRCQPRVVGLAVFLAAAFYMCIFSPRTELNTYALLAMPCGLAIGFLLVDNRRWHWAAVLGVALVLCAATGTTPTLQDFFERWARPMFMTAIAVPLLLWLGLGYGKDNIVVATGGRD